MLLSSKHTPANFFRLHLAVIAGLFFFHAIGIGAIFRTFLYINMLFVLYRYITCQDLFKEQFLPRQTVKLLFLAWFSMYFVNVVATTSLIVPKELMHLFYALFIPLGLLMHTQDTERCLMRYGISLFIVLSFIYVLIQLIMLYFMHTQHGTLKNPHYLAHYSLIVFIGTLFSFSRQDTLLKQLILGLILATSGWLLVLSHSRPAWLALLVVLSFYLLAQRKQLYTMLFIAGMIALIAILDIGGSATHLKLLLANLQHEERVYIWRDVALKIYDSNILQCFFGRGIGQFSVQYSAFGAIELGQLVTFNSPHNFILELVYTSGIAGLLIAVFMYALLFWKLLSVLRQYHSIQSAVYCLTSILAANLFFTGITIPFFGNGHLVIALFVAGMTLYWLNLNHAK